MSKTMVLWKNKGSVVQGSRVQRRAQSSNWIEDERELDWSRDRRIQDWGKV